MLSAVAVPQRGCCPRGVRWALEEAEFVVVLASSVARREGRTALVTSGPLRWARNFCHWVVYDKPWPYFYSATWYEIPLLQPMHSRRTGRPA